MTRAVRVRLSIFGTAGAIALTGLVYTTVVDRAIDTRLNDELVFAYDNHLTTVRELVKFAREHRVQPAKDLERALTENIDRPNPRDRLEFEGFESKHRSVTTAARELITTLDGDLDPEDTRLAHLIRRFDSEERALGRIHERFHPASFAWMLGSLIP